MIIKQDLHIHTHCSCDSASLHIPEIVQHCQNLGFEHFGISDHLHTAFNMPDIEIANREFNAFGHVKGFHFGIEVTCATKWECEMIAKREYASCFVCNVLGKPFQTMTPIDGIMYGGPAGGPLQIDLTRDDIERLGIEYVIAGVHKPDYSEHNFKAVLEDWYSQLCYLANHELVDIIAHPWEGLPFWSGDCIVNRSSPQDFGLYLQIPQEYWDTLGELMVKNGKLAEFNPCIILAERIPEVIRFKIIEKMAGWKEQGVKFTFGSDSHREYKEDHILKCDEILSKFGFTENDFGLPEALKNK
ncbi:MAG: PHP domain-containing protein [Lentisphaeria bacterium]|nr:PHP domain-containing protein [Lentisphaeria bacterium]